MLILISYVHITVRLYLYLASWTPPSLDFFLFKAVIPDPDLAPPLFFIKILNFSHLVPNQTSKSGYSLEP